MIGFQAPPIALETREVLKKVGPRRNICFGLKQHVARAESFTQHFFRIGTHVVGVQAAEHANLSHHADRCVPSNAVEEVEIFAGKQCLVERFDFAGQLAANKE